MKALRSTLASKVLKAAFYSRELSQKLLEGKVFKFEGKLYMQKLIPKASK